MPSHLNKKEKAQCKVVFTLLITSLLIQRVSEKVLNEETKQDLPAVVECTQMIDEILASSEYDRRKLMVQKIQTHRVRLTKKVANFDVSASLLGALDYISSGTIKYQKGTRLAYIIETFSDNLKVMQHSLPEHVDSSKNFKKIFAKEIANI